MTTPDSPHRPKSNAPALWLAVGVVVVLLGVVAVLATGGSSDDDSKADGAGSGTTVPTEVEPGETPLPPFEASTDDPAIGMTIPTVSGTEVHGEPMTISADGKAKVILFVAHWCPHCQREVPAIVGHLEDTPMPDDVDLVGVSTGVDPSAPNYPPVDWLDDEDWEAPTLADTDDKLVASTFGLSGFPFFVVADADGKVVHRVSGEISLDYFDTLVEAAQTGEMPG